MNQRNDMDKKLLNLTTELSEALTTYKYEEAWNKAGELNSLLKNREQFSLPGYMLDMIGQHVKSYYYQNSTVQKAHKAMSAIGHKLEEFK